MAGWDDFLTERDRRVFAASGYGARGGLGARPLVLVVDVNHEFCGERPEPILDAVDRWPLSAGEQAWAAVGRIVELLGAARANGVPVVYSTSPSAGPAYDYGLGRWRDKNPRSTGTPSSAHGVEIVAPIAPQPSDLVISKSKPSVFFGTELVTYLIDRAIDTVVVCGVTTSGCVRATVTDGFSYNFRMAVVEECTFDRGQASHWINLFDMDQKYADVMPLGEIIAYFDGLERG